MILPIIRYKPGKVIAGSGLQSMKAGGKTLLSVNQSRQSFRGAFYCTLLISGDSKAGAEVRVGVGTVNGLVPFLGSKKLDDEKAETLTVKNFNKDGYAWVLVRVRTNEAGLMNAAGGKDGSYKREDLEIVAGDVPRRVTREDGWVAEHALAILKQGDSGGIEIRQIVYFDLQHGVNRVDGIVRHFFN